jgi:hypothetical protein
MAVNTDRALQPLVLRLRAQYPEVRILEARLTKWTDGFLQQTIHYRAPLDSLRRCGLVTDEMLRCRSVLSSCGYTSMGEAFHLNRSSGRAAAGCWDLDICTESAPRELEQLELSEAGRTLANLFERKKPSG